MSRLKKTIASVLVLCLIFSCVTATAANKGVTYKSTDSNFSATKISHPENKQGEVDGLIDYESGDADRGQSYAWSAIGYGDYIYVGTCYAAIYSTMVQMCKSNPNMDLEGIKKASDVAFNGAMYMGDEKNNPENKNRSVLVKINTKTGEAKIVDGPYDMGGYRAAVEFKGKLYFACATSKPAPYLLEIDPENGDAAKKVFQCEKPNDRTISVGIRGLTVVGDQLISSAIGNDGAYIVASKNPSEGKDSFKVIATQEQLFDYPAYHYYDDIFGGSIWDMVSFNGKLYFTVVTGKRNKKQSFAMFVGEENSNGEWEYRLLVGDKDKGAKYPFGLGNSRSGAANLIVHDDHIYIGSYNDPMVNIPAAIFKLEFTKLYEDLSSPAQLWRMDKNENIEMITGEPNEIFPEVKGNMKAGFGNPLNQYIWRMASYDGKLYAGTIDLGSVLNPFREFFNGDIFKLSSSEINSRLRYLGKFLKYLASPKAPKTLSSASLKSDVKELMGALKDLKPLLKKGGVENVDASVKFLNIYKKATKVHTQIREYLPSDITKTLDTVLNEESVHNFYCFTQIAKFIVNSNAGFDLAVTDDGINFKMITRNGFGDKYNHGLRSFAINNEGLFCGTANPFYGAQVWHITENGSNPSNPEAESTTQSNSSNPSLPNDATTDVSSNETANTPEGNKDESPNTGINTLGIALAASALAAGVVLALITKNKKIHD